MSGIAVLQGDALSVLRTLPAESFQACVTSPPYFGLRDYGVEGQIGLEDTPDAYVARLADVFREVRRCLRADGTLWLNLGDTYAGSWGAQSKRLTPQQQGWKNGIENMPKLARRMGAVRAAGVKPKDLYGIPWMVAFALRADGWWLRRDIIWHKPNAMPESIKDRPTTAHEYLFLLTKSESYRYDAAAIREGLQTDPSERYEERARITGRGSQRAAAVRGGDRDKSGGFPPSAAGKRNARSVWTIATQPFDGAHFATMPPRLVERCLLAGSWPGDAVLDPFAGAGTTGLVASRLRRSATLIELNPEYVDLARWRIHGDAPLLVAAE